MPGEHTVGTQSDRAVLERLIRDPSERVANQASVIYLRTFVRVDTGYLRKHVSLYYTLRSGCDRREMPDISSAAFHRSELGRDVENAGASGSIQVLGMIGSKEDASLLRPFVASRNPFVASTAAVALYRLGFEKDGLQGLKRIASLPISSRDLYYKIEAIRLLAEVDVKYFESKFPAWAKSIKHHKAATPRRWWRLTQIAWSRGLEIN